MLSSHSYSKSVFSELHHNQLVNEQRRNCHFHLQIRIVKAGRLSGGPKFSREVTVWWRKPGMVPVKGASCRQEKSGGRRKLLELWIRGQEPQWIKTALFWCRPKRSVSPSLYCGVHTKPRVKRHGILKEQSPIVSGESRLCTSLLLHLQLANFSQLLG